jgi:REP element-mobilizing transposase RayT
MVEYPGALYHVLSRGNGGQEIFLDDEDRHLFFNLLAELSERFNVEIYAFVLMGNHYHLLLKTIDANLSKAMQWFGTTYTRKYNLKNKTSGHLFQGRFKSIVVENDAYLLMLSCYIHRNPLRAGIVERIADYPWSSYLNYAYRKKAPEWLETRNILSQVSGENPYRSYRIKVQNYSDEKAGIWEDVKHGLLYGGQEFIEDIKIRFLGDRENAELPQHNSLLGTLDPERILKNGSEHLGLNLEAVRKAKKISIENKDKRDLMIYLLRQAGRLSNSAIGAYFGLTYSFVSRRVKIISDKIETDQAIRRKYKDLKSKIKV